MQIGLMVFRATDREHTRKRPYATIRAIAHQAATDGCDSIWLADHRLYRTPGAPPRGIWECWIMLAALAEATQRVAIGTLVLCTSCRHPAILAHMATTAAEVSGGRLILGVGAGWNEPEYAAFGLPFDQRVDRFAEAVPILGPLRQEGHVDFAGQSYHARNCADVPRGPRQAEPPWLVGSEGSRMLKLTAQYADRWNTGCMGAPATMAAPLATIDAACRAIGRAPAPLGITALIGLWFPDRHAKQPRFFDTPLPGTMPELAAAMRGDAHRGVQHIMFQCEPDTREARQRLTEARRLSRGSGQHEARLLQIDA